MLSGVSPALASVAKSERLISWSSLATGSLALVVVLVAVEAIVWRLLLELGGFNHCAADFKSGMNRREQTLRHYADRAAKHSMVRRMDADVPQD